MALKLSSSLKPWAGHRWLLGSGRLGSGRVCQSRFSTLLLRDNIKSIRRQHEYVDNINTIYLKYTDNINT
jgi:hypothetical protein